MIEHLCYIHPRNNLVFLQDNNIRKIFFSFSLSPLKNSGRGGVSVELIDYSEENVRKVLNVPLSHGFPPDLYLRRVRTCEDFFREVEN